MRRRALLSTLGATVLGGCSSRLGGDETDSGAATDSGTTPDSESKTAPETTASATTTADESPLELTDHELVRPNEGSASELATVSGTARNPTDETVAEATVTATFEADGGEALDRASASASDLSPGQSWSFELVYAGTGEDARAVADYALDVEVGD